MWREKRSVRQENSNNTATMNLTGTCPIIQTNTCDHLKIPNQLKTDM